MGKRKCIAKGDLMHRGLRKIGSREEHSRKEKIKPQSPEYS